MSSPDVFWGNQLPSLKLYDANWNLIVQWNFKELDGFKFNPRILRSIDSEEETEDEGKIRQRIAGCRVFFDIRIMNTDNRSMLKFLRLMYFNATHIIFSPHPGGMKNPNTNNYDFEVLMDSDFEPKYIRDAWQGHSIEFTIKTLGLLIDIPEDIGKTITITPATQIKVGGVWIADPETSLTFFDEKMIYGGWEITEEELSEIAYYELPPEGQEDPRGVW